MTIHDHFADLGAFVARRDRLPWLGDVQPPWHYRGWLVPYIALTEAHPNVSPRYSYVTRTLEAGELLDEPIPQIHFLSEHDSQTKPGMKQIEKMVEMISYRSSTWNGFQDLCFWLGYALGVRLARNKRVRELWRDR